MDNLSFMLALDGSEESLYAAETAQYLAKKVNARVEGLHVVDKAGALKFLGPSKTGIIGSGMYMLAYEELCTSLKAIADKLAEAYTARFNQMNQAPEFVIEEGNRCRQILTRAMEHKLVVLGYSPAPMPDMISYLHARLSLVEQLTHECNQPLLIVRKPLTEVSELTAVVDSNHISMDWLKGCWLAARQLGVPFTISLAPTNNRSASVAEFTRQLIADAPEFYRVMVKALPEEGPEGRSTVLPVVPTTMKENHRMVTSGECPAVLLRTSHFDAVLIWPVEHKTALFGMTSDIMTAV